MFLIHVFLYAGVYCSSADGGYPTDTPQRRPQKKTSKETQKQVVCIRYAHISTQKLKEKRSGKQKC